MRKSNHLKHLKQVVKFSCQSQANSQVNCSGSVQKPNFWTLIIYFGQVHFWTQIFGTPEATLTTKILIYPRDVQSTRIFQRWEYQQYDLTLVQIHRSLWNTIWKFPQKELWLPPLQWNPLGVWHHFWPQFMAVNAILLKCPITTQTLKKEANHTYKSWVARAILIMQVVMLLK
jgi:hypothetical protein